MFVEHINIIRTHWTSRCFYLSLWDISNPNPAPLCHPRFSFAGPFKKKNPGNAPIFLLWITAVLSVLIHLAIKTKKKKKKKIPLTQIYLLSSHFWSAMIVWLTTLTCADEEDCQQVSSQHDLLKYCYENSLIHRTTAGLHPQHAQSAGVFKLPWRSHLHQRDTSHFFCSKVSDHLGSFTLSGTFTQTNRQSCCLWLISSPLRKSKLWKKGYLVTRFLCSLLAASEDHTVA